MNISIIKGCFRSTQLTYISKNKKHKFKFEFFPQGNQVKIKCLDHPSYNGKSSDPEKTHLYRSKFICFIQGKEPKTMKRAKQLAAQWAEYFLDYRITGKVQR